MNELLWFLLPIAAASGWLAARRSAQKAESRPSPTVLRSDYFKGLNFLLNEQPDKAIDVFIRLLEVDKDTVETHLALGNLYRRRGEVDRAIRLHQNLIARPALNPEQRSEALLELGKDYMRAGLLDRAEGLFEELVETPTFGSLALRQLTSIYQQQKDWAKAARTALHLERSSGESSGIVIAHYLCEEAETLRASGQYEQAMQRTAEALRHSDDCVRASILEGRLFEHAGDDEAAIRAYRRVERQAPVYLSEVVEPLRYCYKRLGRQQEYAGYLEHLLETYGGVAALLSLADIRRREQGEEAAAEFLVHELRGRPSVRGLDLFIELSTHRLEGNAREFLEVLKVLTTRMLEELSAYQCDHCGFKGKELHWRCPSCCHWGTIKPRREIRTS